MTSFLSYITYDPLETWLQPKSGMLCMNRYQEDTPKDAREDGEEIEEMQKKLQAPDDRPAPDA